MNTAIIVAGGSGTRMNTSVKKQYLPLLGISVLRRTLDTFNSCEDIDRICLVVPEEDIPYCNENVLNKLKSVKDIFLVAGGHERQQSVYKGITFYEDSGENDIIVIHDGVRPLISNNAIKSCINGAKEYGASIIAVPAFDTIKKSGSENYIEKTLNRKHIWLAQTPQAFKYRIIKKAHDYAIKNKIQGTDDASIVELIGVRVKLITGCRTNIKITTNEDLIIAEALINKYC